MTVFRHTKKTTWDLDDWDTLVWDDATGSIEREIKRPQSFPFRKMYIKRRQISDGLFESDWVEVTRDVKQWGTISREIDFQRQGKLQFSGFEVLMQNVEGRYNPNTNADSLWSGYGDQQRTLVKIEAGFYFRWQRTDGHYVNEIFPDDPTVFVGIISGNIPVSSSNEILLPIAPLTTVFRDFPASLLTGFTSTGMTSSQFIELLRDQTDGSSNFIFRPFFGDTTANWLVTATSVNYSNLNTSTAADIYNLNVWRVIEKLAQSEQFAPIITPTGKFKWIPKTVDSATSFEFFGLGINVNTEYGQTIKQIFSYQKKLTNFYSRVAVKFVDENTSTSFVNTGLAFAITGSNTAWNLGHRTFDIDNFWIPNSTVAASVASAVFDQVSSLDEEIRFSTSLIPHLDLLNRVDISYDATDFSQQNQFWDLADWDDMVWDTQRGDAISLVSEPFKIIQIQLDLENLETRFAARQLNE